MNNLKRKSEITEAAESKHRLPNITFFIIVSLYLQKCNPRAKLVTLGMTYLRSKILRGKLYKINIFILL